MSGITSDLGKNLAADAFGGTFDPHGRGFFVALELFAILRGQYLLDRIEGTDSMLCQPDFSKDGTYKLRYLRNSHDFARRLAFGVDGDHPNVSKLDPSVTNTLRSLLQSLTISFPGRRDTTAWTQVYFYPYVGELIHYDTALRGRSKKQLSIERNQYRGAGSLAYAMLAADPDRIRLAATRKHLLDLVCDSQTPLGNIAQALQALDEARAVNERGELSTFTSGVRCILAPEGRETNWPELLRTGVNNICARREASRASRVEHLMHWVPYCISRHQLDLAAMILGKTVPAIIVDMRTAASTVRVCARANLEEAKVDIREALVKRAQAELDEARRNEPQKAMLLQALINGRNQKWCGEPRSFYTTTQAAVGGLNATTGSQHYCLQPQLLEAMVHALLPSGSEIELENFLDAHLFGRLRVIVGTKSLEARNCVQQQSNLSEFNDNAEAAANILRSLGLLSDYSDTTRMVHAEVRA